MALRYYINFAPTQNISPGITNSATSVTVTSFSGWPTSYPFTATLDYGLASAEVVLVTAVSGGTATIQRGYDNTVAVAHAAGATFDLTPTAKDLQEANAHINNTAGVHGVSGNVVGTSDIQTLTNKTFSGTTAFGSISGSSATFTGALTATGLSAGGGTVSGGNATFSGAFQAQSSTITGNEVVQGNETVNGSLTVTGNQTNAGNLQASSATVTGSITAGASVIGAVVSGIVAPKQYTNEAAANTAGANITGNLVYLTAPTTPNMAAGLFQYISGAWAQVSVVSDTGWTVPTLGNSWVSYKPTDSQFADPQWRKRGDRVTLKGAMKSGTQGTTIFTLPAGSRPADTESFIVFSGSGGLARVDVLATGAVIVQSYQGGSNSVVVLTSISFIAEQ